MTPLTPHIEPSPNDPAPTPSDVALAFSQQAAVMGETTVTMTHGQLVSVRARVRMALVEMREAGQ